MATHPTLLVLAALALASGAAFLYVGRAMRDRPVHAASARQAARMFALWWHGLAGVNALIGAAYALAAFDALGGAAASTVLHVILPLTCVAFTGLVFYLWFVARGEPASLRTIAAYYVAVYLVSLYVLAWAHPTGSVVTAWSLTPTFARLPPLWVSLLDATAIVGPPIFATLRYAGLYRAVDRPTQRYRIVLTATSILSWIAIYLAAPVEISGSDAWLAVATRAIGLGAAALMVLAYEPPRYVRQKYHVISVREEDRAPPVRVH